MTSKEQNRELYDAAVKLSSILLAKGAAEEDGQLSLLGHAIITSCRAINNSQTAMLLQHHLNEFVDSVNLLQENTTAAEVGLERASANQN